VATLGGEETQPPAMQPSMPPAASKTPTSTVTPPAPAGAEAPAAAPVASQPNRYGTVTRAHYRYAFDGESGLTVGHFHLFPGGSLLTATVEAYTEKKTWEPLEFSTYSFESNAGRPFYPAHPWGKAFGWVARFQSAPGAYAVLSAGLQWDISRTPGVAIPGMQWKSFIQIFAKSRDDAGIFDVFNWYEFVLVEKRMILRGTNVWYIMHGRGDSLRLTQDLVFPVHPKLDLYLRHFYQNNNHIDDTRSDGSQFSLGGRYTF
jgi:hypothetical protein